MKYIIAILFLFCFSGKLCAQDDVLEVSFKTELRIEGGDRFVEIDIYFTPRWDLSEYINAFELRMDINDKFFNAAPTDLGNNDFNFYTYDSDWSDTKYWPKPYANLALIGNLSIMQISRMSTTATVRYLAAARRKEDSPLALKNIPYKFGHISWKLLPSAMNTLRMRIREYSIENGANCSAASDDYNSPLPLQFVGDNIERDETGAACIVISVDNPFESLDSPTDLAGNTLICGTTQVEEYTVNVPTSVDSCRWYISSDEAGENPVGGDVASIVVSEKGGKAVVTWKETAGLANYYLQVQSLKDSKESDPIHMAVRIENFPDFAGSVIEKIECRSTELSWLSSKDGITVQLYAPDYAGGGEDSPFTCDVEDTYHFVRYRDANYCKDTVDYTPSFLNPKLAWSQAPQLTLQRGENFDVLLHKPTYPATLSDPKIEYIWTKPEVLDPSIVAYREVAVNKSYEFEVYAKVNGCSSDTLTAITTVEGGGIKPMLSSESGLDIACDGGILLKSQPDGGSGNYSYKWYANAINGTPIATTSSVWVTPTKNTTYFVVVTDDDSGEEVSDSLEVTYKQENSPVITAGEDQRIIAGTYTYLLASVVKDGSSTDYTWNWKPEDKLAASNAQNVQTVVLNDRQMFQVYVVDANGCMSKLDTLNVIVDSDLAPDLRPDDPNEEFALTIVPENSELCKNNSVQFELKTSGINLEEASYAWTPALGLNDADIANPILTIVDGVVSGEYFVTVTKDDFKIVRKAAIKVNLQEEAPQLQLANNRMSCTGDVIQVVAVGAEPDQYVWSIDGSEISHSESSYTLVDAGKHTVKVYGKNNGSVCASDTLSVSETFGEGVILSDLTSDVTICGSETILSFTSITPEDASFKWLASDYSEISTTDKSITVQESGEYCLVKGTGVCADTSRIQVKLNNVLSVEGLKPVITGCYSTADLVFDSTTAPSFVWLNEQGEELANSRDKNPFTVESEGIYQLRLDGGDCQETYSVVVLINTKPLVNGVNDALTTCGEELAICGSASEGTLYWAEDREGRNVITSGVLKGVNETKTYYVYADAGDGCKGEMQEVQVSFGSAPKVLTDLIQTTCDVPYTLRASTTGTGSVKWYDAATSKTPISEIATADAGTSREYWVCAEDDETCVSERVKVLVKFGVAPQLEVNALQTTCGEELRLQASTTGGELVWKEVGSTQPLLVTRVTGLAGEVKHYEVYASDGACISETKTVEVRFGANPEVLANSLYTTCGDQFTLNGSASGGSLTWYSDANARNPLTSLEVSRGSADVATYYVRATDGTCQSPIKDIRVAFGANPYVEALTPQTSCKSDALIALQASTTGGQLVWEKEDGTRLSSVLVNTAGTYYVYAEDGSCKSTKESVEVKFGVNPILNVELTQTTCGKEHTLSATTSGGVLRWYDSQAGDRKEINTLVSGSLGTSAIYYVKAVDGTCESEEKEVTVRFGMLPSVTVEPDMTTCENVYKLVASTTGGTLYWKEKTSGKILPTPQVSAVAGSSVTYVVYAQDETCKSKEQEVTVHYGNKPQIDVMTLQTACDDNHTLVATAEGEVKWFESDQVTELTNLDVYGERGSSSTYWVYVEKDGCRSDMTEVTVAFGELPVVEVLTPQTTCGTSLTLEAAVSGGNAVWKKMDGSELTNLTVSGLSGVTDVYYVYAEDGSCKGAEEKVEVQFGTVPQVIVEKDITTCDEEYVLTAEVTDAKAIIHWLEEDKQTPATIAKGASGSSKKYYVYASTAECESPMTEVTVHFGASPILNVMPISACDTLAVLTAQASVPELVWTDANGKELMSTQVHGAAGTSHIYYVQAKDGRCVSQQEAVRVSFGKAPELIVEDIQTVCDGTQYELQAQATGKADIVWYQADGVTQLTSTTVNKAGSDASVYYVEARDGSCVSDKKSVSVLFDQEPLLNVEKELQTTCGTSLTLQAVASAGQVVWMREDGTVLDLPQVTGEAGAVQHYYAYAQDGSCESTKKAVEVRFGVSPEVDVNEVQTACGESHTLTAIASDGVLHWLEADKNTELLSSIVTGSKGTEKTYYVYAENGSDCRSELYPVTVMFGVSPMLVDLITPQTTCGTSVQLSANSTAGTIEWRDALGNLLKTPLVSKTEPGEYIYYAQAKDETCAGASQEVTVKFGARPEVVVVPTQTTCATDAYTIEASATEGILHYLAVDQQTELSSATVNASGTYYVYAKALDCVSDTVAVEVKLGTKPEVLLDEREQSTCEDMLYLQASATGGNLYWEKVLDNGEVEPLLIPQVSATDGVSMCYVYAADSRDDNTCRSEKARVMLEFGAKPTVIVEAYQTTCEVNDYELQASVSGGNIYWLEQDGVTPLASTIVSGEENTTASYWVYAERGTCRSERQEVTVAFGVPPIVSVLDTLTSCDTKLTLHATTSAGTLTWLDEESAVVTNLNITNVTGKPKTYYVYAKDGSCESVKHPVVALFNTQPLVLAEWLQTTCEPENYELKAEASDGTLYWLDSDKNPLTSTIVSGKRGESVDYYVYAEKDAATCKSKEYKVTVEFGVAPMLETISPQTVCGTGEVMVDLKASATGGTLVWEDEEGNRLASTQQKANAPATKYYYVHAEDKTCASVTEKVEVRFGGQPVVLVNELQTACGESLTLSGSASSGTLVWSDGNNELTSLAVTRAQGDTYYVKAKDGNCESGQTTVQVVFNTLPMVEVLTPQTTCGTQLQLKAEATGGHLVWLNANGDKLNLTQVSGTKGTKATYFVYAEGEGCESPQEIVEVEFGSIPQVIAEENQTACGTSHVLTASATDGELVWLDAAKKLLASTTVTGNEGESKDYYVYAKAIDCESEPQKVTVHFGQLPIVSVNALQTTCETALTLQASATAGKIIWTNEDGEILPTPVVTGNKGENAYYYVTAEDGTCHSTTERVEVRFGSAPEVLLASDVVTTCGMEYNLQASASSGVVNWYASKESAVKLASTLVRKPDGADYAEYYAQAQNGTCVGEKQKVTVVFGSKPLVTVTTPMSSCDTVLVLSAQTTGGDLVWMNSGSELLSTPTVHGAAGSVGRYYVQAQDASCQSEIKEVFVNFGASPSINVETQQTSCETKMELQASATGGFVYWLKDDKQPLASTHIEGAKGTSARYYVYAADAGCVGDTVEVNVAFGTDPQIDVVDLQTSCNEILELQAKTSGGVLQWTTESGDIILPAVVTKPSSGDQLTCYVQAIDGTCATALKPVTVKFGAMPEVFAESLQTSCETECTLVATASAGSIVWEDEKHRVLPSATVEGSGIKTYYVYASVGRNCASEKQQVKVAFATNPIVTVEPLQTSCGQEALQLKATASGGALVWTRENGMRLTDTKVTPEMGETYQVYAQDGKCKSVEETVEVRFGVKPVVTVEPVQTTCGTSLQLKASTSGGTIVWVNDDSEPISSTITSAGGNSQTVYVYAEDGDCMSEVHEISVKFGQRPTLQDLESAQSACASPYRLQASSTGGEIVWLRNGKEIAGNWVDLEEGENIFFVHVEDASCSPVASADEKVTVTLGGRPELTLSTTQCAGDTIYAEETNGMENLKYRWFVNGQEDKDFTASTYVFAEGGEYSVQVVAETENGCVSDTAAAVYQIATPLRIAWDSRPVNTIGYGNNISGCVKVVEGDAEGVTWNWLSPASVTGTCVSMAANEPEYEFEVYAVDQYGCSSDTVEAATKVTGFGVLEVTLTSESGTEICKGGSALLVAEVEGGQAPYTYEWFVDGNKTPVQTMTTSSTINVLTLMPDADATYTVKVRDSQLKPAIANKEIALTMKEATVPVADAGPDMTIQRGLQTLLKPASGDDIIAWQWLPIDKLAAMEEAEKQYPLTAALSTSQKYQLFVTNDEGCVSRPDEMVVYVLPLDGTEGGDLPTPPVSEGLNLAIQPLTDTLCLGAERWIAIKDLLGNLSGNATYTWVADPAVTLKMNTKRDSVLFVPAAAGDYTFSAFVEDGGKKMALRSRIQVKDAQAPRFELAVTGDCQQDTVKLTYEDNSLPATGWEWKVKGTAVANDADYYILSAAGSYTVEVRAQSNGCYSDVKTVDVTVENAPVITDLAVVDSCGQAVIEVTATGATAGYTWTATPKGKAEGDNRYVIAEEGEYQVKVVASNGVCSVERTLEGEVYSRPQLQDWVTEPMDVAAGSNITAAVAVQTGGKADFVYHWLQPEGAKDVTTGIYTQTAELANYTFEVYASDANSCVSDTLKKSVAVTGGKIVVEIVSVYGKEICQNGAAMVVARAKGATTPCLFEWSKIGAAGYVRSAMQHSEYDTLWVEAAKAGDYQVAVRQDASSKILASGQIDGLTVSTSRKAPVVTTEAVLTIPQGGHTVLLAEVADGTPAYQWHWSPAGQLATPADTAAQYPQTAALDAKQEYRVYVTDAESCVSVPAKTLVDIDDNNGLCVAIYPKNTEICRGNAVYMNADVTCGKPTEWELEYRWEPSEQATELLNAANKDSVIFTPKTNGEYTWIVKVTNGDMVAAARATVTVKDADAPVLALQGRWDCVNDTLVLENSGEVADKYVWTVDGIETAEAGERFVLTDADVKEVRVYAQAVNGCLSDTVTVATQLGVIPQVEIAESAFVNYPDSVHILRVKQADGLTEEAYDFTWTTLPDDKINGSRSGLSVTTVPMTEDVKYTFVATSKNNPVCQAQDTAWGYMIPKAAAVEIDKDENTGDLYLAWSEEELGLADSVRIMNIKWDGYAVESSYAPLTMAAGEAEKYIIDTSKDTLEFFYINASRYIPELGRSYYSMSSDTVGYMRQWLYGSPISSQKNFIGFPFDMIKQEVKTTGDIIEYIGFNSMGKYAISTLAYWNGSGWKAVSASSANKIGTTNNIDIVLGSVYRVVLRSNEDVEFLLYGNLPQRFEYKLSAVNQNFILTPLAMGHMTTRYEVGDLINGIKNVGSFIFSQQSWRVSTLSNAGKWGGTTGDFNINVLRPLRITLNSNVPEINWKY